jgi:hypothetical protein
MSTTFLDKIQAVLADRRVQIGGVSAALVLTLGGFAVAVADRGGSPIGPDLADRAGLAVVMQPGPGGETPQPVGRMATMDPSQEAATRAEPVDPALRAMLDQERREDAQSAAEQRAFDQRLRADLAGPPPSEPPAHQGGSTSNSEDTGDAG